MMACTQSQSVSLCLLITMIMSFVKTEILVLSTNTTITITTMHDCLANFGPMTSADGLTGRVVYVEPHDACNGRVHPPPLEKDTQWIALIARGVCSYENKVTAVQDAGYSAAIVHNYPGDNSLVPMTPDENHKRKVVIPSVFVGFSSGMDLAQLYNFKHRTVLVTIKDYADSSFAMPIAAPVIAVASAGLIFFILCAIKKAYVYLRTRYSCHRSRRAVRNIPTKKFKKGDRYDMCAICLEDFEEGKNLRVLPCQHTYHMQCIDPWLIERKKSCPQCMQRIDMVEEDADERTPLIHAGPTIAQVLPRGSVRLAQARVVSERAASRRSRQTASHPSVHSTIPPPSMIWEHCSVGCTASCCVSINGGQDTAQVLDDRGPSTSGARPSVHSAAGHPEQWQYDGPADMVEEPQGAVGGVEVSDVWYLDRAAEDELPAIQERFRQNYGALCSPPTAPGVQEWYQQTSHSPCDDDDVSIALTSSGQHSPAGVEDSGRAAFTSSLSNTDV